MSDPTELAEELKEDLGDDSDATLEELEESFENLLNYSVPPQEAMNSLRRQYGGDLSDGGDGDSSGGGDPDTQLDSIDSDEEWITVNVEVVELWEPRSEAVDQVGLVGDESGTMKFVTFTSSEIETDLEEGQTYRLSPVVTDEYQGRFSIKLNRQTEIEEIDEDIEVDDGSMDITVPIVDVQDGSGLIKRCPHEEEEDNTCGRPIRNGRCSEHGEVDGEFDLRIKAVGDNGKETIDILFNRETTEELTGLELEEAKQMATDAMDTSVVADQISEQIVGNYYHITGGMPFDNLLVDTCDPVDTDTKTEARDMLNEVGA